MESETCDSCGRDDYRKPSVAVDAVALREGESGVEALLIRRGGEPVCPRSTFGVCPLASFVRRWSLARSTLVC